MNDKYKDLYHKAVDRCVAEAERQGLTHEEGIAWLWEKEYARLIIQECLEAIHHHAVETSEYNSIIRCEAERSIGLIKQHFGLDEE